jgi:hypothetical protein
MIKNFSLSIRDSKQKLQMKSIMWNSIMFWDSIQETENCEIDCQIKEYSFLFVMIWFNK